MNGWFRLWIVFSIAWIVTTSVTLYVVLPAEGAGPWIKYRMDEQHQKYFDALFSGSSLSFAVPLKDARMQFNLGDFKTRPTANELKEKLPALEKVAGEELNPFELEIFARAVGKNWSEARAASESYDLLLKGQEQKRSDQIFVGILTMLAGPLTVLLIGLAVAWVRAGFASSAASKKATGQSNRDEG